MAGERYHKRARASCAGRNFVANFLSTGKGGYTRSTHTIGARAAFLLAVDHGGAGRLQLIDLPVGGSGSVGCNRPISSAHRIAAECRNYFRDAGYAPI